MGAVIPEGGRDSVPHLFISGSNIFIAQNWIRIEISYKKISINLFLNFIYF